MNTKATEVESKIVEITNLTAKTAFNRKATKTENKTFDNTGFIKTPKSNRLSKIGFQARIKEAMKRLASKS